MEIREKSLLENKIFLAGIYIDPRYRILLSVDQIIHAKKSLCDIILKLQALDTVKQKDLPQLKLEMSDQNLIRDHKNMNFTNYLDEKAKTNENNLITKENLTSIQNIKSIHNALEEVDKYGRESRLDFKSVILLYPNFIIPAARIINAFPPTQVSVERLFLALKIIKSDNRSSLKEDIIEAILFLRDLN